MIDVENEIFDFIAKKVREEHGDNVKLVSRESLDISEFPCVSIVEVNNYTLTKTQDTTHTERHASILYEVNVYSNKTVGAKQETKEIANTVDECMLNFGFTRTSMHPIALEQATIYRMVIRYTAVVDKNHMIYKRN